MIGIYGSLSHMRDNLVGRLVAILMTAALLLALVAAIAQSPAGGSPASQNTDSPQAAKRQARDMLVMSYDWDSMDRRLDRRFLTIVEPDGSNLRFLATSDTVKSFDVSPNGLKIAYVTNDGLWTIGINGKGDKKVVAAGKGVTLTTPTWSKNGKQIWFGSYGGPAGLRVNKYNLKKKKLISEVIETDLAVQRMDLFEMSPDGKKLLIVPNEQFRDDRGFPPLIYNIRTGKATELPRTTVSEAVWTPDNNLITLDLIFGYEYVDLADRSIVTILDSSIGSVVTSMDISPDGSTMLFHDNTSRRFYWIDVASGASTLVEFVEPFDAFDDTRFGNVLGGQIKWIRSKTYPDPVACYGWVITKRDGNRGRRITGTAGGDVIWTGGGNDVIDARGGDDVVCGSDGDDVIYGGAGDDFLNGNNGDDVIYGGPGDDIIWGDDGADRLYGQAGDDHLFYDDDDIDYIGGAGDDDCNDSSCFP